MLMLSQTQSVLSQNKRVDFMFRIWFLNFFDHPVICYEFINTLYRYSKVKLVENSQRKATFLKQILVHAAESTFW